MSKRITFRSLATAGLVLVAAAAAAAQDFPVRPVRLIVGFPPGGGNDLLARMLATKLTEQLGKQVVVDNRAGASGVVASEITAASAPDGHTLMVVSIAHTANPALYKLKYDTEKAFTPIAMLGAGASVLAVHSDVAANSVRELLDLARKAPGTLHMAHAGNGTYQHMSSSLLASMAGIDVVMVPFKGGGPAIIDVVGGHSQLLLVSHANVTGHIKSGKLRVLAMTSAQRHDNLPGIPTIAEAGVSGYVSDNWWGVVGPAGIPAPLVNRLIAEILIAQDSREVRDTLEKEGARVVKLAGSQFAKHLAEETVKWAKVVNEGKIKL